MDPTRLTASLEEARQVIGGVEDTRDFVVQELIHANVNIKKDSDLCYSFLKAELPSTLQHYFSGSGNAVKISFASPTPRGYTYIGRNHVFVEDLSRRVVNESINGGEMAACRAMVLETADVTKKTTILLMRVRSVIKDKKDTNRQLVGEEMIFIGYKGNVDAISQKQIFDRAIEWINDEATLRKHTDEIAMERAEHLVNAFSQYRTYLTAAEYQVVEPVLPMDVIAAYVFIPKI